MKKRIYILITSVVVVVLGLLFVFHLEGHSSDGYKNISINQYKNKIDSNQSFVIYVYSSTCPACKKFKPKLNSTIEKEDAKVLALNINKKKNRDNKFLDKNNIVATPTLIFYKDGKVNDKKEGVISKRNLSRFLESKP